MGLKEFEIPITGIRQGTIESSFQVGRNLFDQFENSLVENGDLNAKVELSKNETLMDLKFDIQGKVELVCDRSLDKFWMELRVEKEHVFKFGDHEEEYSEEITLIPFDSSSINVGQLIYEFIGLEIPFRKLHPRFLNEDGTEKEFDFSQESEDEKKDIDPRWEELKKFRNEK